MSLLRSLSGLLPVAAGPACPGSFSALNHASPQAQGLLMAVQLGATDRELLGSPILRTSRPLRFIDNFSHIKPLPAANFGTADQVIVDHRRIPPPNTSFFRIYDLSFAGGGLVANGETNVHNRDGWRAEGAALYFTSNGTNVLARLGNVDNGSGYVWLILQEGTSSTTYYRYSPALGDTIPTAPSSSFGVSNWLNSGTPLYFGANVNGFYNSGTGSCTTVHHYFSVYRGALAPSEMLQIINLYENNPYDLWLTPSPTRVFVVSGATTINMGTADETDTAGSFSITKQVAIGTADESDTAGAFTTSKRLTVGSASETDTAGAFALTKSVTVGTASETDTAGSFSITKQVSIGTADESDTAGAFTTAKSLTIGAAFETDAAGAFALTKSVTVGVASETDTAGAFTATKSLIIGTASETDTAGAFSITTSVNIGTATETDTANAPTITRVVPVGTATEIDSAGVFTATIGVAVGTAAETDTAGTFTISRVVTIGTASEIDSAGAVIVTGTQVGEAVETDTAGAFTISRVVAVGTVSEADTAGVFTPSRVVTIGTAVETDSASTFAVTSSTQVSAAAETDTAGAFTISRVVAVGTAFETDAAGAFSITLGTLAATASEVDTAGAFTISKIVYIGTALETDTAGEFSYGCPPHEYHPRGRQGIGVAQPQTGPDYPLIAPSSDVEYLLADVQLTYDDVGEYGGTPFVPPYRIHWMYGFGCEAGAEQDTASASSSASSASASAWSANSADITYEPTHDADLTIVDANNRVVFHSPDAANFATREWGDRLRVYEWLDDRLGNCLVVTHTKWPPAQSDFTPRYYPQEFYPENATLDMRATRKLPKRVRSVTVILDNMSKVDLDFTAGYNMEILTSEINRRGSLRNITGVRFNAAPGAGLGIYPGCGPEELAIRTINGIGPNSTGDFYIAATDCTWVRRPTDVISLAPRLTLPTIASAPGSVPDVGLPDPLAGTTKTALGWPLNDDPAYAHLQFGNDCKPCCDCPDFVAVATYMNAVRDDWHDIGETMEGIRDQYHTNRLRWLEARQCFHQRPLRLFLQSQACPYLDVVLQLCNQTERCLEEVELTVDFETDPPGGVGYEVPGFTFITGATKKKGRQSTKTERYQMDGMWPSFSAFFDSVNPGQSVHAKFRLEFDRCGVFNGTEDFSSSSSGSALDIPIPIAVTGVLTGTVSGAPIFVFRGPLDSSSSASALDRETETLACPPEEGQSFERAVCCETEEIAQ